MSTRSRTVAAFAGTGLILSLAACGAPLTAAPSCRDGSGFALSLVSDTGGQPSPVAAATWFVRHGGISGLPKHGWRLVTQGADGAEVTAGASTLHATQGRDATWQVDGGTRCG